MSHEKLKETRKGSKILLIGGIVLILVSLPLLGFGTYYLLRNQETDSESFAQSTISRITTPTYAFVIGPQGGNQNSNNEVLMARELRWTVKNNNPEKELFIGLCWVDSGYTYLKSFKSVVPMNWTYHYESYKVTTSIPKDSWPSGVENAPAQPPSQETFWLKSDQGKGSIEVTWSAGTGKYYLFIMNIDGSPGIDADINLGYRVGLYTWLPYVLIPLGLIFCVVGIFVIKRRR